MAKVMRQNDALAAVGGRRRRRGGQRGGGGAGADQKFEHAVEVANEDGLSKLLTTEKPVVVLIMARWCPQCQRTFPHLDAAAATLKGKGIDVYVIDWDKGIGHAQLKGERVSFPTFATVGGKKIRLLGDMGDVRENSETLSKALEGEMSGAKGGRRKRRSRRRRRVNRRTRRRRY